MNPALWVLYDRFFDLWNSYSYGCYSNACWIRKHFILRPPALLASDPTSIAMRFLLPFYTYFILTLYWTHVLLLLCINIFFFWFLSVERISWNNNIPQFFEFMLLLLILGHFCLNLQYFRMFCVFYY